MEEYFDGFVSGFLRKRGKAINEYDSTEDALRDFVVYLKDRFNNADILSEIYDLFNKRTRKGDW